MHRWIGVLTAAVLVAGCSALPKPFQKEGFRASSNLVTLPDGGAISVRIDKSSPDGLKKTLESALIAAFAKANIPASSDPGFSADFLLKSEIVIDRSLVLRPETLNFTWELFSADGTLAVSFEQFVQGENAGWLMSNSPLLTRTAGDVAQLLAEYIQNNQADDLKNMSANTSRPVGSVARLTPKIYLMAVDGAPGNGNMALHQSLLFILKRDGCEVVRSRQDAQYLVKGVVSVSQPFHGKSDVSITWRVISSDGKELGKINQNNSVPVGALNNRWGRIAFAVAKGASAGIKDVVGRAGHGNQSKPGLEIPIQEKMLENSKS